VPALTALASAGAPFERNTLADAGTSIASATIPATSAGLGHDSPIHLRWRGLFRSMKPLSRITRDNSLPRSARHN